MNIIVRWYVVVQRVRESLTKHDTLITSLTKSKTQRPDKEATARCCPDGTKRLIACIKLNRE